MQNRSQLRRQSPIRGGSNSSSTREKELIKGCKRSLDHEPPSTDHSRCIVKRGVPRRGEAELRGSNQGGSVRPADRHSDNPLQTNNLLHSSPPHSLFTHPPTAICLGKLRPDRGQQPLLSESLLPRPLLPHHHYHRQPSPSPTPCCLIQSTAPCLRGRGTSSGMTTSNLSHRDTLAAAAAAGPPAHRG